MSTEENSPTSNAQGVSPEQRAREAASKVAEKAAWLTNPQSTTDAPVEHAHEAALRFDHPAEQFSKPKLEALILQFQTRDQSNEGDSPKTFEVFLKETADADLKAAKRGAVLRLQAAIAYAPDDETRRELQELLEHVREAKSPREIASVLATVPAKAATAMAKSDADKIHEMNELHKDLYANDAVYRAKVDEITAKAAVLIGDADKRRAASNEIAEKHGIYTDHDAAMTDMVEKYNNLKDKTSFEARKLEIQMLEMEKLQNEARIKALRERGLETEAKELEAQRPPIDKAREEAEKLYKEQQKAFIEAQTRKMREAGMSEEDIKSSVESLKAKQAVFLSELKTADADRYLEEAKILEDKKKQLLDAKSIIAESSQREVPNIVQESNLKGKLAYTEVSQASEKTPPSVPAQQTGIDPNQIG